MRESEMSGRAGSGGIPDAEQMASAISGADLRVLVLCLYHLTGDRKWLAAPYRPVRDVRMVADPTAGFPEEIQRDIRDEIAALLADGVRWPAVGDPGAELFHQMMSFGLGEEVPAEYVRMMRVDFGFEDGDAEWVASPPPTPRSVVIVGAGVSGLCLAAKLLRLGIPVTVLERQADVGGTWLENRYPGCGVDTPNHFYSYSFAPNPDWRHYFSPREEIEDYLRNFADGFDLRERIRFSTEFIGAGWDAETRRWQISVRDAEGREGMLEADYLVSATGHFDEPQEVSFANAEAFHGQVFHTARWPEGVDLAGKRVAVVGTGASAMQIVPAIADEVASLTIFQRTPQWSRPVAEYKLQVDGSAQWLFRNVPFYARWYRFMQFWRYGDGLLRFLRKDPAWTDPEHSVNKTNARHRQEITAYIEEQLASRPELVEKCIPDYPPFGKRILIDAGWYRTLCKPNVELVTEPIDRFSSEGLVTRDGELHPADVVIMATGFVVTDLAARFDIRGKDGVTLAEDWANQNPTAYLGITVPRFPNFFVMYGPNTNIGHGGSAMWLAETQSRYISGCIRLATEHALPELEVRETRRKEYTERVDAAHAELIWSHPRTNSYYRTSSGKVRSPIPFRLVDYWEMTRVPDLDDFLAPSDG